MLLGIDGSTLRLPNHPELFEQFTPVPMNTEPNLATKMYPLARISVLYDLLNRVGLDGQLRPGSEGEVGLAIEQLDQARVGHYCHRPRLHRLPVSIGRCVHGSGLHQPLLDRVVCGGAGVVSDESSRPQHHYKDNGHPDHREHLLDCGRKLELTVRFISLRLPSGELEVLVTSLIDEQKYPTEEFLKVYNWRWNEETFFFLVKSRLDLENFSGHTAEAVRQDFYSTLLLSNIETVLIEPTASTLERGKSGSQLPQGG